MDERLRSDGHSRWNDGASMNSGRITIGRLSPEPGGVVTNESLSAPDPRATCIRAIFLPAGGFSADLTLVEAH